MLNYDIKEQRIKKAYAIGYLSDPPRLTLEVSDWAWELAKSRLVPDTPAIMYFADSYNLQPNTTVPVPGFDWGWGNIFKTTDQPLKWVASIPHSDSFEQESWQVASRSLLASLQLLVLSLLLIADAPQSESEALSEQQLLTLEIPRWDGLSAHLCRDLVFWLARRPNAILPSVALAMTESHYWLKGQKGGVEACCADVGEEGALHLTVPGNRCGLDPDFNRRPCFGYELQPHNVDTPIQALTLILGLAALCDLVLVGD